MIVDYAESRYMYRLPDYPDPNDSEGWQYEADDALMWMNDIEHDNERYYMIEENSLYLMDMEDILWKPSSVPIFHLIGLFCVNAVIAMPLMILFGANVTMNSICGNGHVNVAISMVEV